MGLPGFPKGDWYGLADRAVACFERYVDQFEPEDDGTFGKAELMLIQTIHLEYAEKIDSILGDGNFAASKARKFRALQIAAKERSAEARARIQLEYGQETEAASGQR